MSYFDEPLFIEDFNKRLKALLLENRNFDSMLFAFNGCRYRFWGHEFGITHPKALLVKNEGIISILNPSWDYYLYYLKERKALSLSGWLGKIQCRHGALPNDRQCHVFVSRDKHHIFFIYMLDGSYIHTELQRTTSLYKIKEREKAESSFGEIRALLCDKKAARKGGRKRRKTE